MAPKLDIQYVQFYTDGSAAKKVAPVAPLKTIRLPKIQIKKKIVLHIDPVALCGILMAGIMLVLMAVGVFQLRAARQEAKIMSDYVQILQQENTELYTSLTDGYDIQQVRQTALALGMVPKEQVRHVSITVPEAPVAEEPGSWEQFYIFLTGLFA